MAYYALKIIPESCCGAGVPPASHIRISGFWWHPFVFKGVSPKGCFDKNAANAQNIEYGISFTTKLKYPPL
jgi:hypothetical protein